MKSFRMRQEDVERRWFHVDAREQVLGRLAVKVARILMGKEDPRYTPGVDTGDFVVVTGADRIRVTGKKEQKKNYYRHTGYIGGLRSESLGSLRARKPHRIVSEAVRRMLPKNQLGRRMFGRLKVYGGDDHPHGAQSPVRISVPHAKGQWHTETSQR